MRYAGVVTHNPFEFATRERVAPRVHAEAKFEIRARIRNQIEEIDRLISRAIRLADFDAIQKLSARRNEFVEQLP